jgi:hypothetical protein
MNVVENVIADEIAAAGPAAVLRAALSPAKPGLPGVGRRGRAMRATVTPRARRRLPAKRRALAKASGPAGSSWAAQPSAFATSMHGAAARFRNTATGCSVAKREWVGNLTSTVAYAVLNYRVNPGSARLFPWLSGIARQYEFYRFKKLRFIYFGQPAGGTSAGGSVAFVYDYDAADAPPETQQSLFAMDDMLRLPTAGLPNPDSNVLDVNCGRMNKSVRYLVLADDDVSELVDEPDQLFYDCGNLYIATFAQEADDLTCGEIWVEYEVEFDRSDAPEDYYGSRAILGNEILTPVTTTSTVYPFGVDTLSTTVLMDDVGVDLELVLSGTFAGLVAVTIPSGYVFEVQFYMNWTSTVAASSVEAVLTDTAVIDMATGAPAAGLVQGPFVTTGSQTVYLNGTRLPLRTVRFDARNCTAQRLGMFPNCSVGITTGTMTPTVMSAAPYPGATDYVAVLQIRLLDPEEFDTPMSF